MLLPNVEILEVLYFVIFKYNTNKLLFKNIGTLNIKKIINIKTTDMEKLQNKL